MGKVTFHGSYTSQDQIPEANSIVLGRNLRENSKAISTKRTPDKEPPGEGHDHHPLKPNQE